MEQEKTIGQQSQREKNDNQKLYREYLDNQNKMNQLNKLTEPKYFGPQLLMPAYLYPNRPIPLNKKAADSLQFSKQSNKIFDKDMNKFFDWDSQYYTMMDYPNNGRYLGDSMLRHNPITCPVNDYYHNRYINQLKKRSEYIQISPNDNNIKPLERSSSSPHHFPSSNGDKM